MENKSLEDIVRVVIMSVGTAMESISSEMDGVMWTLLAFITIDYITGVIDSVCNKTLSSKTGFKGILKKVALLCIVAVAAIIGTFIFQSDVLKTAVAMYYISNEGISILENCSNIGLPIPKILKDAITKTGDDSDSIVCKSVTGENIHIRREDFLNDEEFEYWKAWSDADYHATEKHDRHQFDNCFTLVDGCDGCSPSAEAVLLEHQEQGGNELGEQILSALTETQYRRIKLYYCHKMTETEIANLDGVGQRRISTSLALGKKKLERIIAKRRKNGG